MKARSATLSRRGERSDGKDKKSPSGAGPPAEPRKRLPFAERRRRILDEAATFFAEYGLTAQTRYLAEACGISQRLLYRFFPTKAALIREVYDDAILGPFKAVWLAQLRDRSKPVESRLTTFYEDYCTTVLTRRWLRLFLYSSLAEAEMAPSYISTIVNQLTEAIVEETAAEQGVTPPATPALVHEVGWVLHGTISHLLIRRHLYHASQEIDLDRLIALHVRSFLSGFRDSVALAGGR